MTATHDPDDTFLAGRFQRRKYKALEMQGDGAARARLGKFFAQRFEERFFGPMRAVPEPQRDGFTLMALSCLIVETLQAFREGCEDTKGDSRNIFRRFFALTPPFRIFAPTTASAAAGLEEHWFFYHIRCGILHEGEARGGWRILRYGPALCDLDERTINAEMFVAELAKEVKEFGDSLAANDHNWGRFKKKMAQVCKNCDR